MKIFNTIIATTLLASTLSATVYENNYLYNDARTLGMGGTGVASGGRANSIFTNPAGNTLTPHSFEVSLFDLGIGTDQDTITNVSTVMELAGGNYDNMSNLIGSNINLGINDFTYIAGGWDSFKMVIGATVHTNLNLSVNNSLSDPNGLLEGQLVAAVSGIVNLGYTFFSNLHTGLSMKYVGTSVVNTGIGLSDMEDLDSVVTTMSEDASNNLTMIPAFDIGVIYDLEDLTNYFSIGVIDSIIDYTKPSVGLSILNIGSSSSTSLDGIVPMTINMGLTLHPMGWKWITVNMDYVDMFDGYEINASRGLAAKLRAGAEVAANSWWGKAGLRVGMMNGTYTAGMNLYLVPLNIEFTTYAEELGGYVGQMLDRRYMLNLGLKF